MQPRDQEADRRLRRGLVVLPLGDSRRQLRHNLAHLAQIQQEAREIVDAISRTLGVPPEATQVVFADVERSDWLTGGKIPPPSGKG